MPYPQEFGSRPGMMLGRLVATPGAAAVSEDFLARGLVLASLLPV